ncbi:hypothetical protein M8494_11755 [Serratia ureilytica]
MTKPAWTGTKFNCGIAMRRHHPCILTGCQCGHCADADFDRRRQKSPPSKPWRHAGRQGGCRRPG